MKDLCLFLKKVGDGIKRVACFKLLGEGMFNQINPCLFFIALESFVEEFMEGGLTHIKRKKGTCGEKTKGGAWSFPCLACLVSVISLRLR